MNPQDYNQTEPTVINPNMVGSQQPVPDSTTMFQPISVPGTVQPTSQQPYFAPQTNQTPQPITNLTGKKPKRSNKKPLIFGIVILFVLVGITVGAVALGGGKKTAKTQDTTQNTAPQGPQPAQAIDVEQASNSISQDVSAHDNNKDFPTDELGDKTLGL